MMKKALSLLLVLCLLLPVFAFAEEGELDIEELYEDVDLDNTEADLDTGDEESAGQNLGTGDVLSDEQKQELAGSLESKDYVPTNLTVDNRYINPNLPDNVINILLLGVDTREAELIDKDIKRADVQMILSYNLDNGSIFFQCFVDKDGIVRAYEPGYRLNGAQEHLILSKVSGIDAKEIYINYALTGKVSDRDLSLLGNPKHKEVCCKLSPLVRLGKIRSIEGLQEIAALRDVVSVNPSYEDGDTVTGEGTLKQIVCRFFIVSESKEDLIHTIEEIYRLLKVTDENGEDMLIGYFDTDLIRSRY